MYLVKYSYYYKCKRRLNLVKQKQNNSSYDYDADLYKLTTGSTNYYVNKDGKYSEEQKRAVQTLIQSSNKTKVVLGIIIWIQNGYIKMIIQSCQKS